MKWRARFRKLVLVALLSSSTFLFSGPANADFISDLLHIADYVSDLVGKVSHIADFAGTIGGMLNPLDYLAAFQGFLDQIGHAMNMTDTERSNTQQNSQAAHDNATSSPNAFQNKLAAYRQPATVESKDVNMLDQAQTKPGEKAKTVNYSTTDVGTLYGTAKKQGDNVSSTYSKENQQAAQQVVSNASGGAVGLTAPKSEWAATPEAIEYNAHYKTVATAQSTSANSFSMAYSNNAPVTDASGNVTSGSDTSRGSEKSSQKSSSYGKNPILQMIGFYSGTVIAFLDMRIKIVTMLPQLMLTLSSLVTMVTDIFNSLFLDNKLAQVMHGQPGSGFEIKKSEQ
jgi:hypothetical protein